MKTVSAVKYAFSAIGIGMLIGSFLMYLHTNSFIDEAARVEGVVIELVQSRSSDSTTYKPRVRFTTLEGQTIEFETPFSSDPPAYSVGEHVEVLYRRGQPQEAKIVGFLSLWFGATLMGGLGSIFFLIGAGIILAGKLGARKDEFLRANGTPIDTDFQSVELNSSLTVNGRHPFRVLTQWQNPLTQELHVFESANLWFDPSSYIKEKKIRVYIDRDNPKKYLVDLSFLPKVAK